MGASSARIRVFTGTWQHDIDQANLLGRHNHVNVKVSLAGACGEVEPPVPGSWQHTGSL